jgi:hypothetical protein
MSGDLPSEIGRDETSVLGQLNDPRPCAPQLPSGRCRQLSLVAPGNYVLTNEIYGEDTWMGDGFGQFKDTATINKLPIDQHEVLALAYPRPLLILEGTADGWNCPQCVYTTMKYTQMVYQALDELDYCGFAHPNHGHCAQSSATEPQQYFTAFSNRFLFGKSDSTAKMFMDSFTFDSTKWLDGAVPTLQ